MIKRLSLALVVLSLCCAFLPTSAFGEKMFYLTIDDSPSAKTEEILDILQEAGVPATFFVIGRYAKYNEDLWDSVRRIEADGHTLACHSFNHNRASLAETVTKFEREVGNFNRTIADILGHDYQARVFRFPYGSTNSYYKRDIKRKATQMGMLWLDWNASNGDGTLTFSSDDEMFAYALKTVPSQGDVVMLVHDHSQRTVRVLPRIIAYYQQQGYTFARLEPDTDLSQCQGLTHGDTPQDEADAQDE